MSYRNSPPTTRADPPPFRQLFHIIAGSTIPIAGIFTPWAGIVVTIGCLGTGSLAIDLLRFRVNWLNQVFVYWLSPLLKHEEARRITGSTYMLIGAFIAFLFFDRNIAVLALLFLSLGDPTAALIGKRTPGPRLLGKSPGGTLAFIAVALLAMFMLTWTGALDYHWSLLVGAVIAGIIEFLPLPLDDNLTIPLISGFFMQSLII
jgi:glycerol-3-phosphate acyltransferase PlsY